MYIASYGDDWAVSQLEEHPDIIVRALAMAWRNAMTMPQNRQQYRASILLPAMELRLEELGTSEEGF